MLINKGIKSNSHTSVGFGRLYVNNLKDLCYHNSKKQGRISMVLSYNQKVLEYGKPAPHGRAINSHVDYLGAYFTPNGNLVEIDKLWKYEIFGNNGEHCFYLNGIFDRFITSDSHYGELSNIETNYILEKLQQEIENIKNSKIKYYEARYSDSTLLTQLSQMEIELCDLFIKCYNSNRLKSATGHINGADKSRNFYDLSEALGISISFDIEYVKYSQDNYYRDLTNKLLLKEILVRHLGYHSIESNWPKTITTSSWNIYEQFYNYLLMDYSVQQVSRFKYDEEKGIYIERPLTEERCYYEKNEQGNVIDTKSVLINIKDYLTSDSELRLRDEIHAIKRLVPLNERPKYFR